MAPLYDADKKGALEGGGKGGGMERRGILPWAAPNEATQCAPRIRPRPKPPPTHPSPPPGAVHYLDFRGRATKTSSKNFQLVHWDHNSGALGAELALQFGKRGGDEFVLDFAWPLSALQAFSLGARGGVGRGGLGLGSWGGCVRGWVALSCAAGALGLERVADQPVPPPSLRPATRSAGGL